MALGLLLAMPLAAQKVTVYPLTHKVTSRERLIDGTTHSLAWSDSIVVLSTDMDKSYAIRCVERWMWNHCHELTASSYSAERDGRYLKISAHWNGNQKAESTDKFEIRDIQPLKIPFTSEAEIKDFQQHFTAHE